MNDSRSYPSMIALMFIVGLLVSVAMALNSQFSRDQLVLQLPGWELFANGRLLPYGAGISGGGLYPGSMHALLSGLPLFVFPDYRSVNFAILASHVLAYLLLDRTLRGALDPRERVLLCLFYWLNPWRVYFSAYLLNTNPLFLLAAIHLWTAHRQRRAASFLHSFVHVLVIGIAFEFHGSFLILAIVSALLHLRGYVRFHRLGAACGATTILLSLIPYLLAVSAHPEMAPGQDGFPGRGLVFLYPVLRGVSYWLRYSSLLLGRQMVRFDFTPALGANLDLVLATGMTWLVRILGPLTAVTALLANVWFWRKSGAAALARLGEEASDREWFMGFARWSFLASLIAFCLSPTTIMVWQVLIVLHAAILPTIFWLGELLRGARAGPVRRGIVAHAVASVLVLVTLAVAAPMFRKGGRQAVRLNVQADHPMFRELGIQRNCTIVIDPQSRNSFDLLEDATIHRSGRQP